MLQPHPDDVTCPARASVAYPRTHARRLPSARAAFLRMHTRMRTLRRHMHSAPMSPAKQSATRSQARSSMLSVACAAAGRAWSRDAPRAASRAGPGAHCALGRRCSRSHAPHAAYAAQAALGSMRGAAPASLHRVGCPSRPPSCTAASLGGDAWTGPLSRSCPLSPLSETVSGKTPAHCLARLGQRDRVSETGSASMVWPLPLLRTRSGLGQERTATWPAGHLRHVTRATSPARHFSARLLAIHRTERRRRGGGGAAAARRTCTSSWTPTWIASRYLSLPITKCEWGCKGSRISMQ
jgi:hypothetical protein